MRIFLDTNVLLRYFVPEDENTHRDCAALIYAIREGKLRPFLSPIVFMEYVYTMKTFYKISKQSILQDISYLLRMRNLVIVEKTDTKAAFMIFTTHNIKFGDCLIATQIPKGANLVTYDEEFKKVPRLSPLTPKQILARMKS